MQNNVTELTQRLLRALDSDYNVTDMPEVVDIISSLEKVAITKELLETTRLGKHVNELRRKTTNELLSKRAKGLLKKWRSMVLPEANGQIKTSPPLQQQQTTPATSPPMPVQRLASPALQPKLLSPGLAQQNQKSVVSPPLTSGVNADVNLNQLKSKKRPAKEALDTVNAKRARVNGVTDLDLSDNSNSSFKDVISGSGASKPPEPKREVIVINSDSNSSFPERGTEPAIDQQQPKKRGRKKGSKNHRSLLDEAETSFSNKLAISASRGSSKVKTTQELLASIQGKSSVLNAVNFKSKEDLEEKAAKLTERVSIIDQKLNTNAGRSKNAQKGKFSLTTGRNERVIESGSVINDKSLLNQLKQENEDEIVVVDDVEDESEIKTESPETEQLKEEESNFPRSLSVEEALSLLPPVEKTALFETTSDSQPTCTCQLKENKPDFSVEEEEEEDSDRRPPFELVEDPLCPAKPYLVDKYRLDDVSRATVSRLHSADLPNINGNPGLGRPKPEPPTENDLYINVVPNIYERLDRDVRPFDAENFKKYSVSEGDGGVGGERTECFREWYECVDLPSYNGEALRILPYCIVD